MSNIVEVIEGMHGKLSKLDFPNGLQDLVEIFAVLGITTVEKFNRRVWNPLEDGEDVNLIDFCSNLLGLSKSDVRRLIKGGGLKVNNVVPKEGVLLKDLNWIWIGDWEFCIIKKGKNEFEFILK